MGDPNPEGVAMPKLLRTTLAAAVTVTADYNANVGTFDHAKFLNANEGGSKTHKSLNWLGRGFPCA
jgi:hypothetical protein